MSLAFRNEPCVTKIWKSKVYGWYLKPHLLKTSERTKPKETFRDLGNEEKVGKEFEMKGRRNKREWYPGNEAYDSNGKSDQLCQILLLIRGEEISLLLY